MGSTVHLTTQPRSLPLAVLAVYGTRPEAIKMAPVINALRRREEAVRLTVCTTGQHREMLEQVHATFDLAPDVDLRLMRANQDLNHLLAAAVDAIDRVIVEREPEWLLVQGDTTTAMAAAVAAFHRRVKVGHVEAGLRTHDLGHPFPEEANRRIVDAISTALFAPTERAARGLIAEGCRTDHVHLVGNTVIDALRRFPVAAANANGRRQVLVTVHRRESFGEPLQRILAALRELAGLFPEVEWVYPVHPNPNVVGPVREALSDLPNFRLSPPLGYAELIAELAASHFVLTDSGGLQEEAPAFAKPVLVLRETTERPEGIECGIARLTGSDTARIVAEASRLLTSPAEYASMARAANPYGDGRAAERIAAVLLGEPWEPFAAERSATMEAS